MTALARPKPIGLDSAAFGRKHDDRAPLLFAAGLAALLHFLAILIPLPDKPLPVTTPPPVEPPRNIRLVLRPPDPPELPEPPEPAVDQPDPEPPRMAVPIPDPPEQLPVIEPPWIVVRPVEVPVIPLDLPLGPIVPPAPEPTLVEPGEPGLFLPVGIYRPDPDYPELARKMRQSGRVVLRAVVDAAGLVKDIEVIFAPDPDLGFSRAAIEAVREWRYQPGELRGRKVSVRMTVVVDFNLY